AAGEVDGYFPKIWGAILLPLMMIGMTALFYILPRFDPLHMNYEGFKNYYEGFILAIVIFFFALQTQVLLWALGIQISTNLIFPIIFGFLFIYIGFLVENAEQNWFVGIRTPWTLTSENVWKKTHRRGGLLFKLAGLASMAAVFLGVYAIWFVIAIIAAVTAYTIIYSYLEFQKERKETQSGPS
ncbi:MAG TPA: SdpI family protein, partial [Methanoregulaceae archaeon]|nr:SdpI family protein [Methanoregulaceae archaeon]